MCISLSLLFSSQPNPLSSQHIRPLLLHTHTWNKRKCEWGKKVIIQESKRKSDCECVDKCGDQGKAWERILYCTTRKEEGYVGGKKDISAWKRVYMIGDTKSKILIFVNLPSCIVFARHFYILSLLFRSTTLNISFQTTSKVFHANDTQYTSCCREQNANNHYRNA